VRDVGSIRNTLAKKLETLYKQEFVHKFPYPDCRKVQKLHPRVARDLVPDLDTYFSFIAGYSSSVMRLDQRPQGEIRAALPRLRRSFYDWCPQYTRLAAEVTNVNTPSLFHDLEVADRLRLGLVTLITELL
jgi:hypothetical protein